MDEFQRMAEDNRRWNDSLTPWGIVMLILLIVHWFLSAEGMLGVIKIACFYITLLILELLLLLRLPARIAQIRAGYASGAKNAMIVTVIVLIIGAIAIPYGLIRCGMDIVMGPEQMTVSDISITKNTGRRGPTTYSLEAGYKRYKISSDTYWELKEKQGATLDIIVYPNTKVLDSYRVVERDETGSSYEADGQS